MLKKNIVLTNSKNENLNKPKKKQMDELSQLINRLSDLFKKNINQLNMNITQNKEIISFIDKRTTYIQTIIKNIINHNYTFDQLKSLEETVEQIKEKNNNNKINLFNDEQNLIIFLEETNVLFKSIKQKYKIKYEEWSHYISISTSSKSKNNSIKINPINNMTDLKDKKIYYKIDYNNYNNYTYIKKRTKSTENKNQFFSNDSKNMHLCKSQKLLTDNMANNRTMKSARNRNNINDKRFNLINLSIPMNNRSHSIYNIDIRNEVLLNKYFKNESKTNLDSVKYSNKNKNKKIESGNINYEREIEHLNKENLYYKKLVNLLTNKSKNDISGISTNNNSNSNSSVIKSSDNKKLIDKLKVKENEILSKDKKIKALYQEISQYKNLINNMNYRNIKSDINYIFNDNNNINNNNQRYKTESNSSNKIKNNKNCNSNDNIIKMVKREDILYQNRNENVDYIGKIRYLERENDMIKSKLNKINFELVQKCKKLENENLLFKKEIIDLKKQLKKEININEDLNKTNKDQKIKFEYEISKINDKRTELSKFLSNKNSEIISLQQEIMLKDKELENYKILLNKKNSNTNIEENEKIKQYYTKIIKEKETKEIELNSEINILNKKNDILSQQNEKKKKEISKLSINIKELEDELVKKKEEINTTNQKIKIDSNKEIKEYEIALKKLKDENDGLKEFTLKQQKLLLDNEQKEEKINLLQKEKETLKQYFIDMDIPLPPLPIIQSNESIHKNNKSKKEKYKTFESKFTEEECFNILLQLNEAKKEIASLKKKNEQLFNDLDSKRLKNECFQHISSEKPLSNYEEEFDLKKMVKGVKDKNRSQDINIDYPGIQQIKEKYRELDFYYNSLEDLVKKMLLSSTCTNKNKTYISELCKIVGFNDDITNKIINNKIKKGILNMFG